MSLLGKLGEIIEKGRDEYENAEAGDFRITEDAGSTENILARGDNLSFMKYLLETKDMKGKIQTIYVDPPFYTKASYQGVFKITEDLPAIKPEAYDDKWTEGMEEYLQMLCSRIFMMKELLADDGLFWIHLDWHVVHYVKVIMDEIFGEKNFINEIIWQYKSGGSSKKHFARKHDTILLYSKNSKYKLNIGKEKSYNREYKPYRFKGVEEFCDDLGWYTMVNQKDIWQIDMVGRTSRERTGYATQKPVALLKRIIKSSTDEGDICADFFCGAGGLAAAADDMDRKWICCDLGSLAVGVSQKRFCGSDVQYSLMTEGYETERGADFKATVRKLDDGLTAVSIDSYRIDTEKLPVSDSEKEKLFVTDQLQLIDYWSIDTAYNGAAHCAQIAFAKGDERIETSTVTDLPVMKEVSIRIVDVFGNSIQKVIETGI
ncbi:MAG: site-specific DNA-methyltransferase [Eubacteriaceae bacterium]|nr:site-specific DNA-methyltransferase [Eubacteriaceae bacterium]